MYYPLLLLLLFFSSAAVVVTLVILKFYSLPFLFSFVVFFCCFVLLFLLLLMLLLLMSLLLLLLLSLLFFSATAVDFVGCVALAFVDNFAVICICIVKPISYLFIQTDIREIKHYQYSDWNEGTDLPKSPESLLALIAKVEIGITQTKTDVIKDHRIAVICLWVWLTANLIIILNNSYMINVFRSW